MLKMTKVNVKNDQSNETDQSNEARVARVCKKGTHDISRQNPG